MIDPITYEQAKAFFDALDANEERVSDGTALALTLFELGFEENDSDVLGDMAEAMMGLTSQDQGAK